MHGNVTQDPLQNKLMADINVTPMVDVMLVLLIIFMVTAPLMVAGIAVELPKTTARPIALPKKPLVVTLASDRSLFIRGERTDAASLVPRLMALRNQEASDPVYLRADKTIPFGDVMELLSQLSASGFPQISLLSRPPGTGPATVTPPHRISAGSGAEAP